MHNKYIRIILLALLVYAGCKRKEQPVVILDYSFNSGWIASYSLKVYSDGHGYLKKNNLKVDSIFSSKQIALDKLNGIIEQIKQVKPLSKYDEYYLQDGSRFNAVIRGEDGQYSAYYVYGDKCPEILKSLERFTYKLSEEKKWIPIKDTAIVFQSFDKIKVVTMKLNSDEMLPPPSKSDIDKK